MLITRLSDEPLDAGEAAAVVSSPRAGAVVSFQGVIRDHDRGRDVVEIEYVAHPSAAAVLESVTAQTSQRALAAGDVEAVFCAHRIGRLKLGELAFLVVVAAAHRAPALALTGLLVDDVKRLLPVWKRQVFADGTDEWVDCP